jgi:hypothetical protein
LDAQAQPLPRRPGTHREVLRIEASTRRALQPRRFRREELYPERVCNLAGHRALQRVEIGARALEAVGPDLGAALRFGKAQVHDDRIALTPHAPLDDVTDTDLAPHFADVGGPVAIGLRGASRNHHASGIRPDPS